MKGRVEEKLNYFVIVSSKLHISLKTYCISKMSARTVCGGGGRKQLIFLILYLLIYFMDECG